MIFKLENRLSASKTIRISGIFIFALFFGDIFWRVRAERAQVEAADALKGRTFFAKREPVGREIIRKCEDEIINSCSSSSDSISGSCSDDSIEICTASSSSNSNNNLSTSNSCTSSSSSSSTSTSSSNTCSNNFSDPSSSSSNQIPWTPRSFSSSSSSSSSSSRSRIPPRVYFQRPWCPGLALASIVPQATDIIYDWLNPLTCKQFADNYGGVSVLVGELGGPDFCAAGPTLIYSNYTITRSMSINEPVYASVKHPQTGIDYAAAAGPIFYPEGRVLYISVAKEVAKLPQVCTI